MTSIADTAAIAVISFAAGMAVLAWARRVQRSAIGDDTMAIADAVQAAPPTLADSFDSYRPRPRPAVPDELARRRQQATR
jgi:hypothetical protein